MAQKSSSCVFCGEGLSMLNRKTIYCCTTQQPACKDCYEKLIPLSREEQGRRALSTGRAVDADKIRTFLAMRQDAEEKKACAEEKRELHLSDKLCVRCGIPMRKMGTRCFQMYEYQSFTDSLLNPASNTLSLDVLFCEQCRKVECFLPPDDPDIE